MKDFLFVFRLNGKTQLPTSPEQMQKATKMWMDWIGGIAAQNKLVDRGNRLERTSGKVVKPGNVITDGPYTEIKEILVGYTVVKSETYEQAVVMAKGCPVLIFGGNVEVREISAL